jgi:ferredoxin
MNKIIDFQYLKTLFDPSEWDLGILSEEYYDECMNSPIKAISHPYGIDMTANPVSSYISAYGKDIKTFLVLAKKTTTTNDYSLYNESSKILSNAGYEYLPVYLNFKKAVVLSGMGTVAKNSLVYNRKFGFQTKFCMYAVEQGFFENLDEIKIDRGLLDLCEGCEDCIKNCPVNAIHETWIDAKKCDNFIGFGNHDEISSIKWNWWEHIGKHRGDYTEEQVREWSNGNQSNIVWDEDYESIDGIIYKNGVPIDLDHCRKCQEQPRCSKMPINN